MDRYRPKEGESLADLFPDVASLWHSTLNGGLTPKDFMRSSDRRVWWECPEGDDHVWEGAIKDRVKAKGCPFCVGKRVSKTNSLATLAPDVAKQWHPSLNGDLTPDDVRSASVKRVWWKCPEGPDHEWEANIDERATSRKRGCPFCAGQRVSVTNSLASLAPHLVKEWDYEKNGDLKPEDVVLKTNKKIAWKCPKGPDHEWIASGNNRDKGTNCPMCANKRVSVTNSLETLYPKVSKEWHPTKNNGVTPREVIAGSNKRYWFKCDKGPDHEWEAIVANRTTRGSDCPMCAGREVSVTNSVATHAPAQVLKEWDYEKNGDVTPESLPIGTHQKVWWKCEKGPDHEWEQEPRHRINRGFDCPMCYGKKLSVTNRLDLLYPEVASQWHPTKNKGETPDQIVAWTQKKYWWKCDKGPDHEWQTTPNKRIRRDQSCPYCAHTKWSITNSFVTLYPEALSYWHPTKNGDTDPKDIIGGGGRFDKYWWKCDKGPDHEWTATANSLTIAGSRCPACVHQQLSVTNSLETLYPLIASEWHPKKNGKLTPADVIAGTHKKVWWQCQVVPEHVWDARIINRTKGGGKGSGCPDCTVYPRSIPEMNLAYELSSVIDFDPTDHKVRFNGRLRDVDIAIEPLNVIVEYDGAYWHRNKQERDTTKTQQMEEAGWTVIRVREEPLESIHPNDIFIDVNTTPKEITDLVLKKIAEVTGKKIPKLKEYLASDERWKEDEALTAIREYQAERAKRKAELKAEKAKKTKKTKKT